MKTVSTFLECRSAPFFPTLVRRAPVIEDAALFGLVAFLKRIKSESGGAP